MDPLSRLWYFLIGGKPDRFILRRSVDELLVHVESLETHVNEYICAHEELKRLLEEGITTLEAGLVEV